MMTPSEKEVLQEPAICCCFEEVPIPVGGKYQPNRMAKAVCHWHYHHSQPAAVGKEWKAWRNEETHKWFVQARGVQESWACINREWAENLAQRFNEYESALRAQAVPEGAIDGKKVEKFFTERMKDSANNVQLPHLFMAWLKEGLFSISPEPETKDEK